MDNSILPCFKIKINRAAVFYDADPQTAAEFLQTLQQSYQQTKTGREILRKTRLHAERYRIIRVMVGGMAFKAGFGKYARVFDLMKRLNVGGMAILGDIYLPADFFKRSRRNAVYTRLLFSHELTHVIHRHDFPRMTLTTEAWAYWHEYKLFMEWQEAGIIGTNLPPPGGAKRGKQIHQTLTEDQQKHPSGPFWKPDLVNNLVGSSYDWYPGFGRVRKKALQVLGKFKRKGSGTHR